MTDHEIYVREFGPQVATYISKLLGAEREATAAVAGARGGCGGSARAGEQSSSGAQECNVEAHRLPTGGDGGAQKQ